MVMVRLQGITMITGILEGGASVWLKLCLFHSSFPHPKSVLNGMTKMNLLFGCFFFIERWLGANRPLGGKRPNIPNAPWDWNIYLHENHKFEPNVGKYSIHGAYGLERTLTHIYIYISGKEHVPIVSILNIYIYIIVEVCTCSLNEYTYIILYK